MPFADNQGVRIHYETEGYGVPVVLQYGQYFPLNIWYEHHYVRVMKDDCRLILVDARGHGDSDKPHDPAAYQMERMASDIVAVLDALHLEKAHYMGYSSGGVLSFDRAVETAIYNTLPHNLDRLLKRHPLKSPVAFIGGESSQEMKQVGMVMTKKVAKQRIQILPGTHLFPMEHPLFADFAGS